MASWLQGKRINEVTLTEEILYKDCLIFGLRICQGVNLTQLRQRFPNYPQTLHTKLWENLAQEGLLILSDDNIRCTPKGLLLADSIALEILSME